MSGISMSGLGLVLRRGRKPADALVSHAQADQLLVDLLTVGIGELGSDPTPPVGPPGPLVDLGDDVAESRPLDGPAARWHRTPSEEAGGRQLNEPTHALGAVASLARLSTMANRSFWAHHPPLVEQLAGPLDGSQPRLQPAMRRGRSQIG